MPLRMDPTGATAQPVTGPLTDAQLRASPVPVSASIEFDGLTNAELRASPVPVSGTVGVSGTVPVSGAFYQATQPVSAASLPLPAGAATQATLAGLLTDAQLRAAAVPVSAAALPLPSGAATEATLAARLAEATFTARTPVLGQAAMAASTPVVLASNQSAVPVSGTFFQATQPVSAASLPLPAGAASESTLVAVNGKLPALVGAQVPVDATGAKTLKSASFSLAATGTVVAAVASKRIKVYAIKLNVSAAISVNFRSGGATALEGAQPMAAKATYTESVKPPAFLFGTTAGQSLDLVITGTGTAAGRVSYFDDDAA